MLLGDLDEGIERTLEVENKENVQETDVWNLERFFSDDEPEEEDVGERGSAWNKSRSRGRWCNEDVDWNGFWYLVWKK